MSYTTVEQRIFTYPPVVNLLEGVPDVESPEKASQVAFAV